MEIFEYGDFKVICESQSTRYGFRHIARLFKNNIEIDFEKICYYNRTWESFEFESVINKLKNNNKDFEEVIKEKEMFKELAKPN